MARIGCAASAPSDQDLDGPTPMVRTALFAVLFKSGRTNLDISVLEMLESQGAAPKEAAQIIDGFVNQRINEVKSPIPFVQWRLLDPFRSTWREIAGVAIPYATRDVDADELDDAQR